MNKQLHDNQHDPAKAWLGYEPNRVAQRQQMEDWATFTQNEVPFWTERPDNYAEVQAARARKREINRHYRAQWIDYREWAYQESCRRGDKAVS